MKLESKVKQTLKKINLSAPKSVLSKEGKKILVALSGGKDSTVTAYLLKKFGYNIQGIHIDLGMSQYSKKCLNAVQELCKNLGIKLHVYDIKKEMGSSMCYLRTTIQSKQDKSGLKNCAICGVIKKSILNKQAKKLKADKIATGHNLDDEAQTFLMNILKGSPELSFNSGPISKNIKDKKFVPRIKPLFYVLENDIRKYSKEKKLPVVYDKCPCAINSYRIQVREFLNALPEKNKENILRNAENILKKIKIKKSEIKHCEICGEPCRDKICKKCELMQ